MRLDLMINILTFQALTKKKLQFLWQTDQTIYTYKRYGKYLRVFLNNKNLGSIMLLLEIYAFNKASEIKKIIPECKINIESSNDPRSYRLSNEKIVKAGYNFK